MALAAPAETDAYLTHLNVRVLYGVGVTFDQLLHLPQVGLLNLLELLHGDTRETALPWKPLLHLRFSRVCCHLWLTPCCC